MPRWRTCSSHSPGGLCAMSEIALSAPSRAVAAAPNELRALFALAKFPLIAMLRNVSTVAFGFLFPIAFIAVFGLIGMGGGPGLRLGVPASDTQGAVFVALNQLPGVKLTEGDPAEMERQLRLGKLDGLVRSDGSQVRLEINAGSPQSQISRLWIQGALDRLNLQAAGVTSP